MKLHNSTAEIFIPDGRPQEEALRRTTHLGIGAHQDDLEFMAFHGIVSCFARDDQWFAGVTCTNGSWFGVAYREDRPRVTGSIQNLIQAGIYPQELWS